MHWINEFFGRNFGEKQKVAQAINMSKECYIEVRSLAQKYLCNSIDDALESNTALKMFGSV